MLKNYLKVAARNLLRHRAHTCINISGLAVGMACCILILAYVQDELSYDRFHTKAARTYRVLRETPNDGGAITTTGTSGGLREALLQDFPEVEQTTRVWLSDPLVQFEGKASPLRIAAVDPALLEIFDFPFVAGHRDCALRNPESTVITDAMARLYFGDEDPIGKVLTVLHPAFQAERVVSGVVHVPDNSSIQFDLPVTEFTHGSARDRCESYILNEAAAEALGWVNPVGMSIRKHSCGEVRDGQVIGVVRDFNFESLHGEIEPVMPAS